MDEKIRYEGKWWTVVARTDTKIIITRKGYYVTIPA